MFITDAAAIALPLPYNQNGAGDASSVSTLINALFANGAGAIRNPATMQAAILAAAGLGAPVVLGGPPVASAEGYWLVDAPTQGVILDLWEEIWAANATIGGAYVNPRVGAAGAWGLTNIGTAYAYPNTVTSTGTPTLCPFVCSLLVDCTSRNHENTFFQLEGWPGTLLRGFGLFGAHSQDFAAHNATKWNISTHGASPYSEKRGTTVFLAPTGWVPTCETIIWPRFKGCTTMQRWFKKDLIKPPDLALTPV